VPPAWLDALAGTSIGRFLASLRALLGRHLLLRLEGILLETPRPQRWETDVIRTSFGERL
jgi:hypothetical protein